MQRSFFDDASGRQAFRRHVKCLSAPLAGGNVDYGEGNSLIQKRSEFLNDSPQNIAHDAAPARPGARAWRRALAGLGVAACLFVLVANAPAAWIADALAGSGAGLGFRAADGTIWKWSLRDVSFSGAMLGEIHGDFDSMRIAVGEIAFDLDSESGPVVGGAQLYHGLGGAIGVRNADADIDLAILRRYRLFGQPLTGKAAVRDVSIRLSDGKCRSAEGEVWTDALSDTTTSLGKGGLELLGGIACDGDRIALSMQGEGADIGAVRVLISIAPAKGYDLEIVARTDKKDVRDALEFSGFEANNGDLELKQSFAF